MRRRLGSLSLSGAGAQPNQDGRCRRQQLPGDPQAAAAAPTGGDGGRRVQPERAGAGGLVDRADELPPPDQRLCAFQDDGCIRHLAARPVQRAGGADPGGGYSRPGRRPHEAKAPAQQYPGDNSSALQPRSLPVDIQAG